MFYLRENTSYFPLEKSCTVGPLPHFVGARLERRSKASFSYLGIENISFLYSAFYGGAAQNKKSKIKNIIN